MVADENHLKQIYLGTPQQYLLNKFIFLNLIAMRLTYLREKENAAKVQLLTIGEQDDPDARQWLYSPLKQTKSKHKQTEHRAKKIRTEASSPNSIRQSTKQALKLHLQQLKKKSIENLQQQRENQKQAMKSMPLKLKHINSLIPEGEGYVPQLQQIQTQAHHRTVEDLYLSKQRSEEKMRPLVYVQDYGDEQERLRTIIKRKILAKDLFKRNKLQKNDKTSKQDKQDKQDKQENDDTMIRCASFKQQANCFKRSILFNATRHRTILPHIF